MHAAPCRWKLHNTYVLAEIQPHDSDDVDEENIGFDSRNDGAWHVNFCPFIILRAGNRTVARPMRGDSAVRKRATNQVRVTAKCCSLLKKIVKRLFVERSVFRRAHNAPSYVVQVTIKESLICCDWFVDSANSASSMSSTCFELTR